MCLAVISGCPVGAGSGDGVGSARAGPVDQEHSLGVVSQDHGQGVLDDVGVVPGAAAGEEEAEGLAHGWLQSDSGGVPRPIAARTPEGGGTVNRTAQWRHDPLAG